MKTYTRTLKEIIDYPALRSSDSIFDMDRCLNKINEKLFYEYLNINYEVVLKDITIETKFDVSYDSRRGSICQVLLFKDEAIAVYMGAGRELDDTEACYILNLEVCKSIVDTVRTIYTKYCDESQLNLEVPLLYWEGTPVDLGENGRKEI